MLNEIYAIPSLGGLLFHSVWWLHYGMLWDGAGEDTHTHNNDSMRSGKCTCMYMRKEEDLDVRSHTHTHSLTHRDRQTHLPKQLMTSFTRLGLIGSMLGLSL